MDRGERVEGLTDEQRLYRPVERSWDRSDGRTRCLIQDEGETLGGASRSDDLDEVRIPKLLPPREVGADRRAACRGPVELDDDDVAGERCLPSVANNDVCRRLDARAELDSVQHAGTPSPS